MISSRSRSPDCYSDFAFDRLLAGDGGEGDGGEGDGGEGGEGMRAHLASCARCTQRLNELRAEREAFEAEAPPLRLGETKEKEEERKNEKEKKSTGRRFRAWPVAGAGLLAAAAAVFLFARFAPDRDAGTRTKGGGLRLGFYVNHGGAVRRGGPDESVEPGDALRFVYSAPRPGYLAVLSVDGKSEASVYYPNAPTAEKIEPGTAVALPASTVLDEVLGAETLYGISCPEPFDVEAMRRELASAPDSPPVRLGCDVDVLTLRKVASPPR